MILNRNSKFELRPYSPGSIVPTSCDIYSDENYIGSIESMYDKWMISLDVDIWATRGFLEEVFCTLKDE